MAAGEPALRDHPDRAACEAELRSVSSLPRRLDSFIQSIERSFLKSLPEGENRAVHVLSVGSVTLHDDEGLVAALAGANRRITCVWTCLPCVPFRFPAHADCGPAPSYVLASDSPHLGDAGHAQRVIAANDPNASTDVRSLAYFTEEAGPASAALVVFPRGIAALPDASTAVRRALEVAGDLGHVISIEQVRRTAAFACPHPPHRSCCPCPGALRTLFPAPPPVVHRGGTG